MDGSGVGGPEGEFGPGPDPFGRTDPPALSLTLWPNRSAGRRGWTWVIAILAVGFSLPLAGLCLAVRRNHLDGRMREEVRLWPDLITVVRHDPDGRVRRWHANPFWVRMKLRDAHVERYLTLEGGGREIELGAFLSPWERETLHADLAAALRRVGADRSTRR